MTQLAEPLSVEKVPENPHHQRRWLILAVLAIAQLMVVLDTTVVNIALPQAQLGLGFDNNGRQWIVTAYALAFGSLLLLGGRIADHYSRKWAFLVGLTGFALASAVGGAAQNFGMLVTARAVQGVFGALLAPAALSLLLTTFTDLKERNKAFGIFGAIVGAGAGVGLLLGGLLTEYLDWRWCMYINLIFAVAAFIGGYLLLVHRRADDTKPLDLPGVVTVGAALFSVVYGFAHAQTDGWLNGVTLGFLAAGVVLLVAFVLLELRASHPLLPMRVVLDRNRGGSYLAIFIVGIGMFGVFLFLTYYLQETLGFSAVRSGLAFLPMVGVTMIVAITGQTVLAARVAPKVLIPAGMLVSAAGMVILTNIGANTGYATHVLPGLLVMGVGIGLVFASAMAAATLGVAAGDAGVASAMVNVGQQVGGSIGTALLSTLAATAASNYLVGKTPTQLVLAQATIHSYTTAFWWSAAIFAAGAIICALMLKPGVPRIAADAVPALAH
jgi:EmrB/QacA subfamily drug resistance transporter